MQQNVAANLKPEIKRKYVLLSAAVANAKYLLA